MITYMATYEIMADGTTICCRLCGHTSADPEDVLNRWCPACRVHHYAPGLAREFAQEARLHRERLSIIASVERLQALTEDPEGRQRLHDYLRHQPERRQGVVRMARVLEEVALTEGNTTPHRPASAGR